MAFYNDPTTYDSKTDTFPADTNPYGIDAQDKVKLGNRENVGTGSVLDYKPRNFDKFAKSEYHVNNLSYPADLLGADNQYGGNYIIFYINVQEDSKVNVTGKANESSDYTPPNVAATSSGLQSAHRYESTSETGMAAVDLQVTAGAAVGVITTTLQGDVGGAGMNLLKGAATVRLAQKATSKTQRLRSAIALHTPNAINVSYGTSWEGADTAEAQLKMLRTGSQQDVKVNLLGGLGEVGKSIDVGLGSLLQQGTNLIGTGAAGGTSAALNDSSGFGNILSAINRQAANSKKEMLFKGVEFRSFAFEYKFAPRSAQELFLVRNIIKMFKFHMHPEYVQGSGHYQYVYPSEFDILYYNNGGESRHLPRYTSCVLESMDVNYTPNGNFTAFGGDSSTDGAPTEIHISLRFKELATLSKNEIADGY